MHNFPLQYVYIDKEGRAWYKKPCEKKQRVDINPYTLASIPVVFDKNATVQSIFNLVENEPVLKAICFYADAFIAESKKDKQSSDVKGALRFNWWEINTNHEDNPLNKMEVSGIDEKGDLYGIDFLGANDIKDLKLVFDYNLPIVDNDEKIITTALVRPTLFQVVYGLFWELSFFGTPEDRVREGTKILEAVKEIKEDNQ